MRVSVLGCGWLGLPFATHLVKKNIEVFGSTTSEEKANLLSENGITPFLIRIEDNTIHGDIDSFLNSDVLFINVPFGKQKENLSAYQELASLVHKSNVKKVLFISSTSVYADTNTIVYEDHDFKQNPAKKALLDLEDIFRKNQHFSTTVVRFSGLLGGSRNPGNFFKEGRIVKNGLAPINLIHLDDCVAILYQIILQNKWNETFQAAADSHPSRKEFYTKATLQMGKIPAVFLEENDTSFKIISNQKIKKELGYSFKYPDLLEMLKNFC